MTRRSLRYRLLLLAAAFIAFAAFVRAARSHDVWINRERRVSPVDGSWCCNTYDCRALADDQVKVTPRGYVIKDTGEVIPASNAAMSGDGQYWQCRRPDKTTRCFFFPPPGT